ncbi:CD1871A family CXXC motif-containing protein [Peptostreptococcaceae bacterium AGR-M142]
MKKKLFLLSFSIALMFFGILRGEMQKVFLKAINICLECIGIG